MVNKTIDAELHAILAESRDSALAEVGADRARFESVFKRILNERTAHLKLANDRSKGMALAVAAEAVVREFGVAAA